MEELPYFYLVTSAAALEERQSEEDQMKVEHCSAVSRQQVVEPTSSRPDRLAEVWQMGAVLEDSDPLVELALQRG